MGMISAIGDNVAANRDALIKGTCGISDLELFPTRYAGQLPCGEIKKATTELQQQLRAYDKGITRTTLLALHEFEQAIADAALSNTVLSSQGTALIGASTVGDMCLTDELYHDANKNEDGSEYLASYDCST